MDHRCIQNVQVIHHIAVSLQSVLVCKVDVFIMLIVWMKSYNFIRPTRISFKINFIHLIIEIFPFLVSSVNNFHKFESHAWEILHRIFNYIYKQNHIEWKSKDQGHFTHQKIEIKCDEFDQIIEAVSFYTYQYHQAQWWGASGLIKSGKSSAGQYQIL